jgi:hypothetical protein
MENDKLFELLDHIRECATCSDNKNCQELLFSKLSEEKIIKEHGLEGNYLARLLARSLSWMTVEESMLMCNLDESGVRDDDMPLPSPDFSDDEDIGDGFDEAVDFGGGFAGMGGVTINHLNNTRQQMRETIRMIFELKDRQSRPQANEQ